MAVVARYGSYGTSHSSTATATPNTHVVFLKCLATVVQTDCGTRTYRDNTVARLRNGLPKNRVRFTGTAEILLLSTEFRRSLGVTTLCNGSCNREAVHTSACSVEVKNVCGEGGGIPSVGSGTSGNDVSLSAG